MGYLQPQEGQGTCASFTRGSLPPKPLPTLPKDLRPIVLGSCASKLFARLLPNRCEPYLGPKTPYQKSARSHRQACDYMFSAWRIFELCRDWGVPLTMVKVDVQKAFDSVDRPKLLAKLRGRLGNTHEMACWEGLLSNTQALLTTPWGTTLFEMLSGIKQGAIESPRFFSLLMEEAVEETALKFEWETRPRLFDDFPFSCSLFMDDGLLWNRTPAQVGLMLDQLLGVLREYGLRLNVKKCQLYCSQDVPGAHTVVVQGVQMVAGKDIEVMGLQMRKGLSVCELLQPLVARAKAKFWSLKHLLRSRTPIKGRVKLLQRVVTGAALWCIAAVPPCRAAMGLLNSMQAMLVGWMMRLSRYQSETWVQFRQRVVRSARNVLHSSGSARWSTLWLQRWWDYSGHRVRTILSEAPPLEVHFWTNFGHFRGGVGFNNQGRGLGMDVTSRS